MKVKPLPIGVENFEDMISNGYYYVDKTQMIRELWEKKGKVTLFTRPRRFGKTLSVSMLQYFFEDTQDEDTNRRNRALFTGLRVMECDSELAGQMAQYPVISLSLKSAKQPDFDLAYDCLLEEIAREYKRHQMILLNITTEEDKIRYQNMMNRKSSRSEAVTSLRFLSDCLYQVMGKKVIILIDEYDVPLENSYFCGFYDRMSDFIRSLFESALKTNPYLEFSVITGCLRISKEAIFTGLNNLNVVSILSNQYDEYFGFSQIETDALLEHYGLGYTKDMVKKWYDGYLFGRSEVYNPWSVINFTAEAAAGGEDFGEAVSAGRISPKPYWSNTSSNSIVKDLIEHADMKLREEIEQLIAGGTVVKQVHEDITYNDIHETDDNLWNFLLFTGYLKKSGEQMVGSRTYVTMALPNMEVKYIYENTILSWFDKKIQAKDLTPLYQALDQGDTDRMEAILTENLMETISFYDYAENYYHGFLTGLLRGNKNYLIKSNRESGLGRPDLILRTPSIRGCARAFIIEIKTAHTFREMEAKCEEGIKQILDMHYREELEEEGYKNICCYVICFWKKETMVRGIPQM